MDRFDDDTLFAELRELRPTPRPEFTAELDERAAAGFPRRSTRSAKTPAARLMERWRAMSPRRRLIPVLGFALVAIVVATVVVAVSQSGGQRLNVNIAENGKIHGIEESGGSEAAGAGATSAPTTSNFGKSARGASHHANGGGGRAASQSGANLPKYETTPTESVEESGAEIEVESAPAEAAEGTEHAGEESAAGTVHVPAGRDIERSAYVVLGTKPGEVAGAAGKVYEAVHAAHGIVLHSSVQSGKGGATGASFELLIPSRKLDDALAAFSSIAEVRQRHDATNDITAPTVGAAEELADSNASIEGLLKELGSVETEAERESVEARLREERRRHAAIRASLDHLHKRASMSEVSVRIVTDHGAGVTPGGSDSGNWGVGDALHDAGHILTIAAGVVLIGLAVLAPIALIAMLFWAGNRFRVRRLRERTLG
jgi:hypothetical protein